MPIAKTIHRWNRTPVSPAGSWHVAALTTSGSLNTRLQPREPTTQNGHAPCGRIASYQASHYMVGRLSVNAGIGKIRVSWRALSGLCRTLGARSGPFRARLDRSGLGLPPAGRSSASAGVTSLRTRGLGHRSAGRAEFDNRGGGVVSPAPWIRSGTPLNRSAPWPRRC